MLQRNILKKLYWEMVRIRAIEEKIAEKYPQGQMRCPVHLSVGQEAIAVGVCAHLTRTDIVMSSHRAHAHYLAKGADAYKMLAEIYGHVDGCSKGRGGSMYLNDLEVNFLGSVPIVASSIPVATGAAWAEKMKNKNTITAVFFGEAAIEEGVSHEAFNFAVLKKIPIIFICENNLYSVYTHLKDRQAQRSITDLIKSHGINVYSADGNDVVKVYETMRQAVKTLRAKNGPVFIEYTTYRWREHCGPAYDNHLGYRTEKEFLKWKKTDPIARLQGILISQHIATREILLSLEVKTNNEIDLLLQKVKRNPAAANSLTEHDVYAI